MCRVQGTYSNLTVVSSMKLKDIGSRRREVCPRIERMEIMSEGTDPLFPCIVDFHLWKEKFLLAFKTLPILLGLNNIKVNLYPPLFFRAGL